VLLSLAFSIAADKGLRLKSYSKDEVKGSYEHNPRGLGVNFDVRKGVMKIEKTTGERIVHYQDIGPYMFLYQVLDQAFIGHGPSMVHVPEDVPREPGTLRTFLEHLKIGNGEAQHKALRNHYQKAISELHNVPEVQLLERVSAALGDNSTRLEILQPFHALCFNLLKQADVDIPHELRAVHAMEEETADQHKQEKRCTSMENRQDINCRGMCGKMCSCWRWFCGDCCWHRGCYEHDLCCNYKLYSSYCLTPFVYGLKCSGYGGYPKCKQSNNNWWK